jgi:hypothetical protein
VAQGFFRSRSGAENEFWPMAPHTTVTIRLNFRLARHAFRICLVPKPVKYNLTSCLKSPVTRARFQTR